MSTFYTLWNPRNSPDKILKLMVTMTMSKVKSRSHHDVAHLQLLTNVPTKVSTSCTLHFLRHSPDKILQIKATTAWSKVNSRSHHDATHLQPPTNVPATYQLLTPFSFQAIARTRFYISRSIQQDQRSNHCLIMTLHTFTP